MAQELARKEWLGLLAKSPAKDLQTLWNAIDTPNNIEWLRPAEIGTVMVRGRMGGTGARFNMGEMTVVRCSVRLVSGEIGHGYVQGRNKAHAEQAAMTDALMQTDQADVIERKILFPLRKDAKERAAHIQTRADKTKVDFFTMVRGED